MVTERKKFEAMAQRAESRFYRWLIRKLLPLSAVLVTGCLNSGPIRSTTKSDAVSMKADDWSITYSSSMPPHPKQDATGWHFDWTGTVHYVLVPFTPKKKPTVLEMTFAVDTVGLVEFHPTSHPEVKANFRPMIERADDNMSTEYGRFWSNQVFYVLATDNQVHTMTVPLTADHWTSVYGHTDQKQFDAMLDNLGKVGVTYGGQFYGHGVSITGGMARFEMISYKIK